MTVDEVILFLKSKSHLELLDPFVEKFIVDQEVNGLTYNSTLLNECSLEKHLKKLGLVAFVLQYQKKNVSTICGKSYRNSITSALAGEVGKYSHPGQVPALQQLEERAYAQKTNEKCVIVPLNLVN